MKKTVLTLSALIFSLALMIPSLMWADDGKHMEEGSGMKMDKSSLGEYKDEKHSQEYKDAENRMKEGSARKEELEKSADQKKMEAREAEKRMIMTVPKREGS